MNISNWPRGKKLLVIFLIIFFFVGMGATIYMVQKQQETQSHAQKATVITLTPPNQSAAAGEEASLDVSLNPGTNQVTFVKLNIKFDSDKFDGSGVEFIANPNSPLQMASGGFTNVSDGEVSVVLQIGADPTKVIQQTTTIGTFNLPIKSDAAAGTTTININKQASQVRSLGGGGKDAFSENVLNDGIGAKVTIGAGQCIPNQSTCSWDASDGATSYHYKVVRSDSPDVVAEGDTSGTSVNFISEPGKTYACEVTANNECGTSDSAKGTSTCQATPTPTISLTPTPTVTPTLTPTPGVTSTPTPTSAVTPTTPQTFVTATPGPTNVIAQGPTITPAPTLPPTGNPVVVGGLLGGILFLLGGLALLFL
jgi:hypothetical protein